jgi:hypothetical protein
MVLALAGAGGTPARMARTYMPLLPAAIRLQNQFVQPWVRCFSPVLFSTYLSTSPSISTSGGR